MDLETLEEEGILKAVEDYLETEFPEEVKFTEELSQENWSKIWLLIGSATEKSFRLGFTEGQQKKEFDSPSREDLISLKDVCHKLAMICERLMELVTEVNGRHVLSSTRRFA